MSDYEPFDQEKHLGSPPWSKDDPNLQAWELEHGHDVRLKCYVEFGCQVIEGSAYERGRAAERQRIVAVLNDAADAQNAKIAAMAGKESWDKPFDSSTAHGMRRAADLIESEAMQTDRPDAPPATRNVQAMLDEEGVAAVQAELDLLRECWGDAADRANKASARAEAAEAKLTEVRAEIDADWPNALGRIRVIMYGLR